MAMVRVMLAMMMMMMMMMMMLALMTVLCNENDDDHHDDIDEMHFGYCHKSHLLYSITQTQLLNFATLLCI